MAYEIHIRRKTAPITLEEWRAVVERTEHVRMAAGGHTITNPKTGEVIEFANAGGDAEIFFPDDGTWNRVLCWSRRGTVSFGATEDFSEPSSHLRRVTAMLAENLRASLIGDEGESYD